MIVTASKLYLPAWLARLCLRATIQKGVGHKYVRREPTGDPKKPWRYYYNLTSGRGHLDTSKIRDGAKFKIADGHVHITKLDGDHAEVVHDETGETARMHVHDLADLIQSHHGEEIERVTKRQEAYVVKRRQRVAEKKSRRAFNLPRSDRAVSNAIEEEIGHDFGTVDMEDQRVRDKIESIFPKSRANKIRHFRDLVIELVKQARKNNEVRTWADLRDARLGGRRAGTDTIFDVIREIGDEIDDEQLKRATIPADAQDEILRREEEEHYRDLYGEDEEGDAREPEDGEADTSFDPEMFKSFRIPSWLAKALERVVEKAADHKYLRRVPTGNPKRPWRYYYRVTGGKHLAHDDEIVAGAAFRAKDGDQEGHFHVTRVDGDDVTVRHDETGREATMKREALRAMLHAEHIEKINAAVKWATETRDAAEKHGTEKQKARARKHAEGVVGAFVKPEPKPEPKGADVMEALYEAGRELENASPNMRDFYVKSSGGQPEFKRAVEQHNAWQSAIKALRGALRKGEATPEIIESATKARDQIQAMIAHANEAIRAKKERDVPKDVPNPAGAELPTFHLNGTPPSRVVEGLTPALEALSRAIDTVKPAEAAPEPEPAKPEAKERKPRAKAEAAPTAPKTAKELFEAHGLLDTLREVNEGTITAENLKAEFGAILAKRDEIRAQLAKLTKDELVRIGGRLWSDTKKDALVDRAWTGILERFNVRSAFSWSPGSETQEQALTRVVNATTQAQIDEHAAKVAKQRGEIAKRIEGVKNPKNLSEFKDRISMLGGEDKLTPEERRRYDEFTALDERERAEAELKKKQAERAEFTRRATETTVENANAKVIPGKHTKKGHDIFTVQLDARVSGDDFKALSNKAKALGGYYSSFRGNGAIPGFIFETNDAAQKFASGVGGGGGSAAPEPEAPAPEPEAKLHGNGPERLRKQAATLEGRADEALGADRQVNTARRAGMAASAEARARGDKAIARTMLAIADGNESGELRHLWGVKTRAHLDMLEEAVQQAKYARIRAEGKASSDEAWRSKPTEADVDRARFPHPYVHKDNARELANEAGKLRGGKQAAARILSHVNGMADNEWRLEGDTPQMRADLETVAELAAKAGKGTFAAAAVQDDLKKFRRATEDMGVKSLPQFRAMLREYLSVRSSPDGESKLARLKREIIGNKIPGYFPTPPGPTRRVMELADVQPGMTVLEPSAGSGNLADAAKKAGGEVEVGEVNESLRAILAEKGHKLVARDTLDHAGKYDRVVMNPPFENGQDIDHVRHAYDQQLAAGGRLVAIVSRGAVERSDKKATAFRAWLEENGAHVEELPDGSFGGADSERKTGVATSLIVLNKPSKIEKAIGDPGAFFGPEGIEKAMESTGRFARLPRHLGAMIWKALGAEDLEKGATHKYIRRVPTGNPKRPWRYYYRVTGGKQLGHEDEMIVGAAFAVKNADQAGHFHIRAVDGDKLTIEHDETGHRETISKDKFRELLHNEHLESIKGARERAEKTAAEAAQYGSEKQKSKTREYAEKLRDAFEPKPKKPKLERKDMAAENVTERLTGDDLAEALRRMGDALYGVDQVRELNDMGFNRLDYASWPGARTAERMQRILRKYKRQLVGSFGELYFQAGLGDRTEDPKGTVGAPRWTSRGDLVIAIQGFISKDKFGDYTALQKRFGLQFSGADRAWFVPAAKVEDFKVLDYQDAMSRLGITVKDPPEMPAEKKAEIKQQIEVEKTRKMTANEVRDGIVARRIRDKIAVVRKPDGRFAFYAPFSEKFNNLFSNKTGQLTGITEYNKGDNHARETFDLALVEEAIDKLRALHPDWEIVTSGVEEAKRERERRDAELRQPIPEVQKHLAPNISLFPYQNEMVRFLEKTNGNALIGDEMGLGKTMQSLAYCAAHGRKAIVVCPKVVRRTWVEEAAKFFPDRFKSLELRSKDLKRGMPDLKGLDLVTVNYESLEKFAPALAEAGFDTIIVDESHRIKNPKAKTTQAVTRIAKKMNHRILLSGTAVKNKKEELYTQLDLVRPGLFESAAELKGATIGGTWNKMRDVYLARQKSSVLKDLPEKTTTITKLEVPGAPDLAPKGLASSSFGPEDAEIARREAIADAADEGKDLRENNVGEYSRLKADLAIAKAPATTEMVQDILDSSDSKVLVFSDSVEAAKAIVEKLGDVAILHHGQMSDDKREAAKKEFQNPETSKRVFVSTRQSLAVGATLTAADKVVFNDLPWTAADVRQAEDRAHRVGQKNAVNVYWVTVQGNAFDEGIADLVKRKYDLSKKINEGKQLSEAERKWMQKPISIDEIRARIRGENVGPEAAGETAVEKALEKGHQDMITARIPQHLGALLWKAQEDALEKGAGHKYLRRVPTGNPKKPYRYYYRVTGGKLLGHDDEMVVGAAFAVKSGDKAGHFHIKAVDGDKITIEHDESGHRETVTRDGLRAMLHAEHAEAIGTARTRAKAAADAAEKHGASAKMKSKTASAAEKLEAHFSEKPAKSATKQNAIPDEIRDTLTRHLKTIQDYREQLDRYRKFGGRYEAEVAEKREDAVKHANEMVDEFIRLAKQNGVDADAVIAELGGRPSTELSAAGAEWLKETKDRKAEGAKEKDAPKVEEKKPEPEPEKASEPELDVASKFKPEPIKPYDQPEKTEKFDLNPKKGGDAWDVGQMMFVKDRNMVAVVTKSTNTHFSEDYGHGISGLVTLASVRSATAEEAAEFRKYDESRKAVAAWKAGEQQVGRIAAKLPGAKTYDDKAPPDAEKVTGTKVWTGPVKSQTEYVTISDDGKRGAYYHGGSYDDYRSTHVIFDATTKAAKDLIDALKNPPTLVPVPFAKDEQERAQRAEDEARKAKAAAKERKEADDGGDQRASSLAQSRLIRLSGKTFDAKDEIKKLGARWNGELKVWEIKTADHNTMKGRSALSDALFRLKKRGVQHELLKALGAEENETMDTIEKSDMLYSGEPLSYWMRRYRGTPFLVEALKIERESMEAVAELREKLESPAAVERASAMLKNAEIDAAYRKAKDALSIRYVKWLESQAASTGMVAASPEPMEKALETETKLPPGVSLQKVRNAVVVRDVRQAATKLLEHQEATQSAQYARENAERLRSSRGAPVGGFATFDRR